jgi:hypothetical protein
MPRLPLLRSIKLTALGLFIFGIYGCSGRLSTLPGALSGGATATGQGTSFGPNMVRTAATTGTPVVGFSDDFSSDAIGGTASGWNNASGVWSVCQSGSGHAYCQASTGLGLALQDSTSGTDYTVSALATDADVAHDSVAIIGHAENLNQYYFFELHPAKGTTTPYWWLAKMNFGVATRLAGGPLNPPDASTKFNLRLSFTGSKIVAALAFDGGTNYQTLATVNDSTFPSGQIGLKTWSATTDNFTNVVVTPIQIPVAPEGAVSTQAFVDSIGMNAHFESSTYTQNTAKVASLIGGLGVRHYRVAAFQILDTPGYANTLAALSASYGIKFDVLSDWTFSAAHVLQAAQVLPTGSVDTVEGPDESDDPGNLKAYDPNFATDIPLYQKSLYSTFKNNGSTSAVTVAGPSFVNFTSYAAVGNLSSSVDVGNMHDYFGGFNPGTSGYGAAGYSFAPSLTYGSIAWNIASAAQATGSKPIYATETGYSTAPIHGGVPLSVQAKYIPRLYLEQFINNVPRTYLYQLIASDTTTAIGSLGIVSPSLVSSPAYTALAGMIAAMGNVSSVQSSTRTYDWSLGGTVANVNHLLLYKPDGTLVLPLWIEVPSYDVNAGSIGALLSVPQQSVNVTVSNVASNGTLWTCNATTGVWSSSPVTLSNGEITLNVSDTVSILELSP